MFSLTFLAQLFLLHKKSFSQKKRKKMILYKSSNLALLSTTTLLSMTTSLLMTTSLSTTSHYIHTVTPGWRQRGQVASLSCTILHYTAPHRTTLHCTHFVILSYHPFCCFVRSVIHHSSFHPQLPHRTPL